MIRGTDAAPLTPQQSDLLTALQQRDANATITSDRRWTIPAVQAVARELEALGLVDTSRMFLHLNIELTDAGRVWRGARDIDPVFDCDRCGESFPLHRASMAALLKLQAMRTEPVTYLCLECAEGSEWERDMGGDPEAEHPR